MRVGDWKILATLDKPPATRTNDLTEEDERRVKEAKLSSFALYNLKLDEAETTDLSAKETEKFDELKALIEEKYREVQKATPTWPAWKFTGAEGKRIEWPDYVPKKKGKGKK